MFRAEHGRDPADARELSGADRQALPPADHRGRRVRPDVLPGEERVGAVGDRHTGRGRHGSSGPTRPPSPTRWPSSRRTPLYTRAGTNGVRQVDVTGLVAAAFTHRDSRAGDPDLHTHVAVANKVQTLDGRWLSHRRAGAVQGHGDRLRDLQHRAWRPTCATSLGLALRRAGPTSTRGQAAGPRDRRRRRRPERALVGPPGQHRGPPRRAGGRVPGDHGRPPTPVEAIALAQQATLETRDAKHEPRTPGRAAHALARRGQSRCSAAPHAVPPWCSAHCTRAPRQRRRCDARGSRDRGRAGPSRDGGTPLDLAGLARARRGATPGPRRRASGRRHGRPAGRPARRRRPRPASVPLARHSSRIDEPAVLRRSRRRQRLHGRRLRAVHLAAHPRRRAAQLVAAAGRRDGPPVRPPARRAGAARGDRQRGHPQRRAGRAGPRDGHLGRAAPAGDRPRRHRQDHRHAGPRPPPGPTAAAP